MVAYLSRKEDPYQVPVRRNGLSHELLHGLSPEEFDREAKALASLTPETRAHMRAALLEQLKTPVDPPSWGPAWIKSGELHGPKVPRKSKFASWFGRKDEDGDPSSELLNAVQPDDLNLIGRNLEKSRQVAHFRPLYLVAVIVAIGIACLAMFVDYQIIRGDVWTRALSNEFMVVPASLQSSVVFKSLQVIFAVLIVHFFLKMTGAYGRNSMIAVAFVFALVMIGGLGYLVAYNNMAGATSATLERPRDDGASSAGSGSIDALFAPAKPANAGAAVATPASLTSDGFSLGLPKLSTTSLANADSWFWLAFASVIFFIVTTVAALYMQTVENNVHNFHIAKDYKDRKRKWTQLHLLQAVDNKG